MRTVQLILGYIIGGSLFLFLIPWGLCSLSRAFDHLIAVNLIPHAGLRITLAVILLLPGLFFAFWSNYFLLTDGKGGPVEVAGIEISPKTQHLVVTGPYQYTRNPMLVGACAFYFAGAIYLNSLIAFAAVVLFTTFMLIFVKLTEEPRLLREFGEEYKEYRRRVPMFLPGIF
jgi:protein-S-isoprenylcysteine O-methyltransferase Ste14